jgi:PIN domain nuclease of toxin-antitoxin system
MPRASRDLRAWTGARSGLRTISIPQIRRLRPSSTGPSPPNLRKERRPRQKGRKKREISARHRAWVVQPREPERISRHGRAVLADLSHELFLSAVTSCEITIKSTAGKLKLPEAPGTYVPRRMADQGLRPLPISHQHALAVFGLPDHHRDPFDRLLIAQANLEDMILITADRMVEKYPVQHLWVGR